MAVNTAERVADVMTDNPVTCSADATITEAAQLMRDQSIGPILVADDQFEGIVTDRDIVVKAVAKGLDPNNTKLREVCTTDTVTLSPEDSVEQAVTLMRKECIRRLPVVEGDRAVGVVSLGDLAIERDPESVLGQISDSTPNN